MPHDEEPHGVGPDHWVDGDSWAQTAWITLCGTAGICLLHSEVQLCINLLVLANLAHHFHLWHLRLRCRNRRA